MIPAPVADRAVAAERVARGLLAAAAIKRIVDAWPGAAYHPVPSFPESDP
jgi:hypothetical protein